jgi:hypothetical protein
MKKIVIMIMIIGCIFITKTFTTANANNEIIIMDQEKVNEFDFEFYPNAQININETIKFKDRSEILKKLGKYADHFDYFVKYDRDNIDPNQEVTILFSLLEGNEYVYSRWKMYDSKTGGLLSSGESTKKNIVRSLP